jgi:Spy/CpxP family protein refolding chaperone
MYRKMLLAAATAGALAAGMVSLSTPADAYVRFGFYAGVGPCYGCYYPYHRRWWWHHHHRHYWWRHHRHWRHYY